jgi:hypothetical protein
MLGDAYGAAIVEALSRYGFLGKNRRRVAKEKRDKKDRCLKN